MQTQYALKQAGLTLPVTKEFQQHITTLLANQVLQKITEAVVINFRDPDYSAESGGFHPVEMRFIRQDNEWYFDYVTDFSYMGRVYPELEKEIDISWSQQYVFLAYVGDLPVNAGRELFELWQSNFIQYHAMNVYTITVLWGS